MIYNSIDLMVAFSSKKHLRYIIVYVCLFFLSVSATLYLGYRLGLLEKQYTSLFVFVIAYASLLMGIYFLQLRIKRINNDQVSKLSAVLEKIRNKDFNAKISLDSEGILGILTETINYTITELKNLYKNLEKEVEDRTNELVNRNQELKNKQDEILKQNNKLKSAYEDLVVSRKKYENLIENLEDEYFFFTKSLNGELLFVSPSVKKILGYDLSEFRKSFKSLMPESEINKKAKSNIEKSLQGEKQPKYNIELYAKDKKFRRLSISEVPVYNDENQLVSVEGLAQDITKYTEAEEKMAEQEEKYRTVFNGTLDFMYLYQVDKKGNPGRFLEVNNHTVKVLGYTREELDELTPLDFSVLPDNDQIEYSSECSIFEDSWQTKDGIFMSVEINNQHLHIRDKKIGVVIARDITERKKAENEIRFMNEELINQKENLEALLDNLTQTQELLVQSEKMAALGQLIAGIAHEINTPLGAIKASIGNLRESLDTALSSLPDLFRENDYKSVELFLFLFRKAKESKHNLGTREKRQFKREIRNKLQEKDIASSEIIADLLVYLELFNDIDEVIEKISSVDSIQILRVVRSFISLLKNSSTISIGVEKATKVVFALKKYAHRDSLGEKVPTDIIDNIETVLTLYQTQIKQAITVKKNYTSLPTVMCYQDEINQVWTNLIQNALHAMSKGGTLTIDAKHNKNSITVLISDTGVGIEPDLIDKIFEPFFTTKKQGEGSGLGLDIVKKIIDKHDGKINVNSILGEGTTFTVTLPIA